MHVLLLVNLRNYVQEMRIILKKFSSADKKFIIEKTTQNTSEILKGYKQPPTRHSPKLRP
jgi:hypothetical protein